MRVDDAVLNCVCFLCVQDTRGGQRRYLYIGTCFFVIVVDGRGRDVGEFVYLVTARHVLRKASEHGYHDFWVRVNRRDGSARHIAINREWHYHDNEAVDLAVVPVDVTGEDDVALIHDGSLVRPELIEKLAIGVGDDLFLPGLFADRPGTDRNRPVIRDGIIAAMTGEDFADDDSGFPYRAYLAEVRSIGGLSGSPVFVHVPPHRIPPPPFPMRSEPPGEVFLLGVIRGHFDYKVALPTAEFSRAELHKINMGIAVVTPSDDLNAVLNSEAVVKERREQINELRRRRAPTLDSALEETQRGPEPERLRIDGALEDAARKLARTPRPEGGFPKPASRKRKPKG